MSWPPRHACLIAAPAVCGHSEAGGRQSRSSDVVDDDDKRTFTDSDRAALQDLLEEADFKRKLAKRAAARRETIKTWTQWAGTATAVLVFGRDAITWALTLLKSWLSGGIP